MANRVLSEYRKRIILVGVVALVVGVTAMAGIVYLPFNHATNNFPSSSTGFCIFPGQPMGAFLRILSDSSTSPVSGASVTAVHYFQGGACTVTSQGSTVHTVERFVTNKTEWYSLSTINAGNYNLSISYLDQ